MSADTNELETEEAFYLHLMDADEPQNETEVRTLLGQWNEENGLSLDWVCWPH